MDTVRKTNVRRGFSLVMIALTLVVLMGFIGLACDVGYGLLVAHQLQNAADAAALAGAGRLKSGQDDARLAAIDVAALNSAAKAPLILDYNATNAADGDIVVGRFDRGERIFTPGTEAPNSIKVVARRTAESANGPLTLFFGRMFGTETVDVSRHAIAMNQGTTGGGLIALCDDCECAFEVSGSPSLDLNGGDIQVNSSDPCGACGNGTAYIEAPGMNINGDLCTTPNVDWPPAVNANTGNSIPDPLAFVPEPSYDGLPDRGAITDSGTFSPGYYSGGIAINGGENVVLLPGIYILDGAGFQVGGNANFTAEGVMLYIPPGTGYVDIDGTGTIYLTPPDPDLYGYPDVGTYEYISIFQSRENANPSRVIGTGLLDLQGTLYFPQTFLEIGGTGDGFGNQLITWQVWLHGTGDITINYEGSYPSAGNDVFLVE